MAPATQMPAPAEIKTQKHGFSGGSRRSRPKGCLARLTVVGMTLLWSSANAIKYIGLLQTYTGEKIGWEPCGELNGRRIECSDIDVHMDQFNPQRSSKVFNIPLIRMRGRNATQNLLLNPGGPGGSSLGFIYGDGANMHDVVGEEFHLLSFDPCGINKSRPAASCYPDVRTRRDCLKWSDRDPIKQSAERYAWTRNYVKSCADNMGKHGQYMNTTQTAADMNSILDAIGQESMLFWGFSYGTVLGQTYAALFPERSRRIIIDGVSDYFDWYESPILRGDFIDTVHVLDGFFDECAKAGDRCSLTSHGKTKEELRGAVMGFLCSLYANLMPVYIDVGMQGVLDYSTILNEAIYGALFSPSTWPELANYLALAMSGNGTPAFLEWEDYETGHIKKGEAIDETLDIIDLNDGATGPEHWPGGRQGLLDMLNPWYQSSPFFFQMNREYYAKQQWAIPKGHDFKPRRGVRTKHPLFVVSTSLDPVCPLAAAKDARDAFEDACLVEIKGYGHCSLALPSLCAAKHVRAYLKNGTLPDKHTVCEADATYFPPPQTKVAARAVLRESDEEEDSSRAVGAGRGAASTGRR